MYILNRWVLLGAAAALGIGSVWLAMRGDEGSPLPIGAPLTPVYPSKPAPSTALSALKTAGMQWQVKASAPVASASSPAIETGPLYGRNGRELDFGGLNAAQYIDKYAPAARRGDARAAYAVYQAESVCAVGNEAVPQFNLPEQRVQFMQEREALATLCAKVSPAQIQERLGFLSQAARSGVHEAQIDFYVEGPYGRTQDAIDSDDPILKAWQQDALMHLKSAVDQCDPYAMGLLANAWDAGDLGGRDASLAATYLVAEAHARRAPLTVAQLAGRFGDELSAQQIEGSMRAGQDMTRNACQNP